jgi:hypothetical protein
MLEHRIPLVRSSSGIGKFVGLQKVFFVLNDRIYRSGEAFFAQPVVLCQVLRDLFDSIVNSPNN